MRGFLSCIFTLFLLGCHLPAQMTWSPDGSKAAYRVGDRAVVIDHTGKMLGDEGSSLGGMAWSNDSKTLYLAKHVDSKQIPPLKFDTANRWVSPVPVPTAPDQKPMSISAWRDDGTTLPLFTLPDRPVWHIALSPDQKWLVVIQQADAQNDGCALYAFYLPGKTLYIVSSLCGLPMCFTGPDRLAFVEPEEKATSVTHGTGFVVEVRLDESAQTLERKRLLNVLCDETIWIQPQGDDLLFTATLMNFPSRAANRTPSVTKLFHYSRADGGLCAIADDVGPIFSLSPDGKQILIEKLSVNEDKITKRELTLIKPNGSDGRVLRDISATPDLPLWPSWKSNDEIVFTPPVDVTRPLRVESDNTVRFDVVLYKLNEMFELQPVKTLSEGWKLELKPFYKVPHPRPATSPTTPAAQ